MFNDQFLNAAQLCRRYSVVRSTLANWVTAGIIPAPHKFGAGAARWRLSELEAREQEIGAARLC